MTRRIEWTACGSIGAHDVGEGGFGGVLHIPLNDVLAAKTEELIMTTTHKQKAQRAKEAQWRDVVELFGDRTLCRECGATIGDMMEVCDAEIDVACDGWVVTELALHPDARNLTACPPEQLTWARGVIGQSVIDNAIVVD